MILARNQFDQRKYFHPKLKVNLYQVVILSYLRYLSLLFAPSVGNSFWPFSRPSVQTSPPPGSTVNYFLSPIWENFHLNLTLSDSQIHSPPLQQLLQSFPPTTLSATSALPALCGQQIHDELEPDPPAEQRLTVCKPVKNSQWGPRELIQAADDDMDFTFHARCSDWQLSGY